MLLFIKKQSVEVCDATGVEFFFYSQAQKLFLHLLNHRLCNAGKTKASIMK